ncbi:MAG TPA: CoA-acylating methylmalonate-semialdehyde dehydrogenase [Candidatus Dormibacteraeota bacterium]|nr:CoA-acylating methylmalonate-semialdehyde dehydrogenase [Candidatus Dormibacteraeota bacterium]
MSNTVGTVQGSEAKVAPSPSALPLVPHFIGGKPDQGESGRRSPVFNPAQGVAIAEVPLADPEEVNRVVAVSRAAQLVWGRFSLSRRTQVLFSFRELLVSRREELAALITREHGKVLADALGEVSRGIENVEFACGLTELLKGGHSLDASTGVDVHELRQPVGVVAGITPFNFPAMVPLWMLSNAIACGNSFILKPSEKDPSASVLIAELFLEAGLPAGVLNVIQGDQLTVECLLDHPDVDAVSFVGSTPIARSIYQRAAASGKRVQALGGAKNHMVVLPDADLEMTADAAVSAAYGSAGERCMAVSVVVAVGAVANPLVEAIAKRVHELRIGDGTDIQSEMGPLVTGPHRERVASFVELGREEGAKVVVDGRQREFEGSGFFLGGSLLDDVRPGMRVYDEEIFGPVLGVVRVASYEEALAVVNQNAYGNGAVIFTRDGSSARTFSRDVEAGMVGINVPVPVPVSAYSFGGWKGSLFGDSHIYGPEGIHFYTRTKVVTTRWPDPSKSQIDLGFPGTR